MLFCNWLKLEEKMENNKICSRCEPLFVTTITLKKSFCISLPQLALYAYSCHPLGLGHYKSVNKTLSAKTIHCSTNFPFPNLPSFAD